MNDFSFSSALSGAATRAGHNASPLQLLCVGTGRDGTTSVAAMIQALYDHEGQNRRAMHEYKARKLYNAYAELQENNDGRYRDLINELIDDCPYNAIVGNGYASILPHFAKAFPDLTLVHLIRSDREACIASLVQDCELFPAGYKYYSNDPAAVTKRITAFHLGQMTRDKWDELSLYDKFSWYYDNTHNLIEKAADQFSNFVKIRMEDLDSENTRRLIARTAIGRDAWIPPPTHLNALVINLAHAPRHRRTKLRWLIRTLNLYLFQNDDSYPVDYFLEKFVAWSGYQLADTDDIDESDRRSCAELAANLNRVESILTGRLREVRNLKRMLKSAAPPEPDPENPIEN